KLPAPTESTINSAGASGPINGKTIPEAVNAATVADPKVMRNSAVMIHASNKGDNCKVEEISFTISPTPLSTNICLKAPPAAIIRIIMAMLFTPSVQDSMASAMGVSCTITAITTDASKATVGSAIKAKNVCEGDSGKTLAPMVPAMMINTGNSATRKLLKPEGKLVSDEKEFISKLTPFSLFMINLGKYTPAIMAMGTVKTSPYSSVIPKSAFSMAAKATGPGCGGKKPWVTDSAAAMGIPMYNLGKPVAEAIANTSGINTTKPAL